MKVEIISDTIQKFDGISYYRCGPYYQRKGRRLHRMVWEYHAGPIPSGYEVHHIDRNRENNNFENLQLLPKREHRSLHMSTPERKEQSRKSIAIAAEHAKQWHSTPEGFRFHSEHVKQYWKNAELRTYICTYCGKEFQTKCVYGAGQNTFCCSNHRAYWRRQQGIDNENRVCPVCGKSFPVNRYVKTVCCSKQCAVRRRWGK